MKKIIHHIKKLRRKPEHVKRHILHVATFIAGGILVLLWIYSLGTKITSDDHQALNAQELQPLSALKDNIIGGYQSIATPNAALNQ